MASIALIWELGADLGHISRFHPIALGLKARGHRVVLILKDVSRVNLIFADEEVEVFKAPYEESSVENGPKQINFTETLFHVGYQHEDRLADRLSQWIQLYTSIKPDLLIFDHSPTAMLASRELDIPKILLGSSFTVPPNESPLPAYKFWDANRIPMRFLHDSENRCVETINNALSTHKIQKINRVHEIYEADHTFIDTSPLLDVYKIRNNVEYLGVFKRPDIGCPPVWPKSDTPRVFVYVKERYKKISTLLAACKNTHCHFLIYCEGLSLEIKKSFSSDNIHFSDQPYRINEIIDSCDFAINHGSSIAELVLQQGKPQLLLPMQMEQTMRAQKIASRSSALIFHPQDHDGHLNALINALFTNKKIKHSALLMAPKLELDEAISDSEKICNKVDVLLRNTGNGQAD